MAKASRPTKASAKKPRLLAGGNPQIVKGDGHGPVRAYIAAMPGWKRDVARSSWRRGSSRRPPSPAGTAGPRGSTTGSRSRSTAPAVPP
jgi:hypothetical protein